MTFNLLTALPYVYRAVQEKEVVEEVIPRLKPYVIIARSLVQMVQNDADLWLKLEAIAHYVFPEGAAAPALPDMQWVQKALNAFGAKQTPPFHIPVDGISGEHTGDAIAIFQTASGLDVDRWFGTASYIEMLVWLKKNNVVIT